MLRAIEPDESPAYPLPWRVDRVYETHPLVTNTGGTALDFVRVFVDAPSSPARTELWGQMLPGETAEVCLCDVDPDDALVTLAWFRPETGVEYLWRFVV